MMKVPDPQCAAQSDSGAGCRRSKAIVTVRTSGSHALTNAAFGNASPKQLIANQQQRHRQSTKGSNCHG
jgi:hypothetical protein